MNLHKEVSLSVILHNVEVDDFREIVRIAHQHLNAQPATQLHGIPFKRQAGLCGPELFRVKSMLQEMGNALGIACPYAVEPDPVDPQFKPTTGYGLKSWDIALRSDKTAGQVIVVGSHG